ncbi:tetratricopeptide repeat protein [Brevibacillus sp. SYP-B805]|uniref:tetratricopeptide repeat protein n=1 Tax=Brevibacillus sp. SYP-B805 TaxID=1578199 RepID=UPI0013EC16E1|nr:tetratricopeptide repeat protein [Brevibacillus sp. SYP-B805]NGQ94793.1 tetratricopeptide repeat protein [Brevibacillus sp. SYP-B805]
MSDYIEFTNEFGHRIQMSREDYEKKIIPHNLELYWDDREKLRQFAMELVRDRFPKQAAIAADRLLELYGPIESALNFRAVVHMHAGEFDQAKTLLLTCLDRFPASGHAHTNLAKIYAMEGDREKAFATLEAGLFKDPNQENGLELYVESFLAMNRREELFERLEQLGQREGAWRPQLIMGRLYLQDENLLKAMQMYKEAIERSRGEEAVVIAVTGELGQAGYLYQLIQIAEQYWSPEFRFPYTGFNYAHALIQTDQREKAAAVLQAMRQHVAEAYQPMVEQFLSRLSEDLAAQHTEAGQEAQPAGEPVKKTWWKFWK